jgi:hypothetical protein
MPMVIPKIVRRLRILFLNNATNADRKRAGWFTNPPYDTSHFPSGELNVALIASQVGKGTSRMNRASNNSHRSGVRAFSATGIVWVIHMETARSCNLTEIYRHHEFVNRDTPACDDGLSVFDPTGPNPNASRDRQQRL